MEIPPGNSHKNRERAQKVVVGSVKRQPKTLTQRFADVFLGDNSTVLGYLINDVVVPAAKDILTDVVTQGIERMLYGETRPPRRSNYGYTRPAGNPYTSYTSYSKPQPTVKPPQSERPVENTRVRFDNIVLQSRAEANQVLVRLQEMLARYDLVTVSDLYDLVGITPNHTDERWGWTNLDNVAINMVNHGGRGYVIALPNPHPINN